MAEGPRIMIVGTSGSGKTTMGRTLAATLDIGFTDLDEVNWRPGWRDRSKLEPDAFLADIAEIAGADTWVTAGNYTLARSVLIPRATDIVLLDLPKWQVMGQVLRRSLARAASGSDVFPGCRETWGRLLSAEHPIRWAWNTYRRRRAEWLDRFASPALAHARRHTVRSHAEGNALIGQFLRLQQ